MIPRASASFLRDQKCEIASCVFMLPPIVICFTEQVKMKFRRQFVHFVLDMAIEFAHHLPMPQHNAAASKSPERANQHSQDAACEHMRRRRYRWHQNYQEEE